MYFDSGVFSRSLTTTNFTDSEARFSFDTLWNITQAIYKTNPLNDSFLYHPNDNQSRICLKYDACVLYSGEAYTEYSFTDFWEIVSAWRVPLVALVATTCLSHLGPPADFFTIVHLLVDPIDTIWSLLYKLALTERHAEWAMNKNKTGLFSRIDSDSPASGLHTPETTSSSRRENPESEDRIRSGERNVHFLQATPTTGDDASQALLASHQSSPVAHTDTLRPLKKQGKTKTTLFERSSRLKVREEQELMDRKKNPMVYEKLDAYAVALIVSAYEDWNFAGGAKKRLLECFSLQLPVQQRRAFRNSCQAAAALLAADRVAVMLPTIGATIVFFVSIGASFWKALLGLPDYPDPNNRSSVNLNRVPHNIAFGAIYFWLPFVILLTGLVGGHQTENSVPRILNNLRKEALQIFQKPGSSDEDVWIRAFKYSTPQRRQRLPVWNLDKFKDFHRGTKHAKFAFSAIATSVSIITLPVIAAMWLSWRTPTEGFNCRTLLELIFWVAWVGRFLLNFPLVWWFKEREANEDGDGAWRQQATFWISLVFDSLLLSGGMVAMGFVTAGLFNDCACWSQWFAFHDNRYISFPQEPYTYEIIRSRLAKEFAIVIGVTFALELIGFGCVWWYFRTGYRVLKQDDIDEKYLPEANDNDPERNASSSPSRVSVDTVVSDQRSSSHSIATEQPPGEMVIQMEGERGTELEDITPVTHDTERYGTRVTQINLSNRDRVQRRDTSNFSPPTPPYPV